jgi:predicted aspartyl protease
LIRPVLLIFLFTSSFGALARTGDPPVKKERPTFNLSIFYSGDPCDDFKTLVIPIKRIQNLIVVEARIDTLIGNFILDTGSPILVLNKTYFRKGWDANQVAVNATGQSVTPVMRTRVDDFAIRELFFENLPADINDLGHIENHRGIKILGLLGVSLFSSFEMIIDVHKSVMYLHKLDSKGAVPEKERIVTSAPTLTVPFRLIRNTISLDVLVAGKKLVFCVDTGAEANALSNRLPARILEAFRVSKRMVLVGTGGAQTEVLMGTVDDMLIGGRSFKNMHAAITRLDDLGEAYGRPIDGILGSNFLVKGIISINFVTKELRMYPFEVSKP